MNDKHLAWEGARRAWLESKRRLSGGENTVEAYEIAFRQFSEWLPCALWEVSAAVAQRWAIRLEQRGLAPASVSQKLAALSSFYDFVKSHYATRGEEGETISLWPAGQPNPFEAVERPKVSRYGQARYPSFDEARAILAAINRECLRGKRDFALLFALLVTCRRASEILNLQWGDLTELEDGHYAFRYRCKGGDYRQGVLIRHCYEAICEYLRSDSRPPAKLAPGAYIFVPLDARPAQRLPNCHKVNGSRPISTAMANKILKKYARRAGVDAAKAHLHGLRHAGARARVMLMKDGGGVDYMEIKELLGHSSIAVTQIYSERVLEAPRDPGGVAAATAFFPDM